MRNAKRRWSKATAMDKDEGNIVYDFGYWNLDIASDLVFLKSVWIQRGSRVDTPFLSSPPSLSRSKNVAFIMFKSIFIILFTLLSNFQYRIRFNASSASLSFNPSTNRSLTITKTSSIK
jgi:hypothetical protein